MDIMFWHFWHYQNPEARIHILGFSKEKSSSIIELPIEPLMEEVKCVVLGIFDLKDRDKVSVTTFVAFLHCLDAEVEIQIEDFQKRLLPVNSCRLIFLAGGKK